MPNGVICAGALDGSNQAGEIVTCHAMTARPAGSAAEDCAGLRAKSARNSEPSNPSRERRICNGVMKPPSHEIFRSLIDANPDGTPLLGWPLLTPWLSSGARLSA